MYYIYIITNIINAKQYIGITKDIDKRWKEHKKAEEDTYFYRAIRKYGAHNFVIKHFASSKDLESAFFIEKMLIKEHATRSPLGYNSTDGGEGLSNPSEEIRNKMRKASTGVKRSDETKKKHALAWLGDKNPMKRDDIRKKRSEYLKGRLANERNPFYGRKHSKETIAKMKATWAIKKAKTESKETV